MSASAEKDACVPVPVDPSKFNPNAEIPYGLTTDHIRMAMAEFTDFLGFLNVQLHGRGLSRMETIMMPANFSSLVGEFVIATLPKHCATLVRNSYHNGHPDLLPAGEYEGNSSQHGDKGIEVKGARYASGWQGHNPEACWLLVFHFDSNRPADSSATVAPKSFKFEGVYLAKLTKKDWKYSGRGEDSRRTITAAVTGAASKRMRANWVYRDAYPAS